MKSIFLGHREFFADLAIAKTGYDFAPHTVVHFNWGGVDASSREGFDETFPGAVADALTAAGYAYDCSVPPSLNLSRALTFFKDRDGKGCVILIDEYDDPVAKALADVPRAEYIRDRLATIYPDFPRSHPISTFPKRITDKTGANADRFAGYCLRKTGKFV